MERQSYSLNAKLSTLNLYPRQLRPGRTGHWGHRGTVAGAAWGTVAARAETVVVGVFLRRAFAECSEPVGEGEHKVACDGVVFAVLYVVGGDAARYVLFLMQEVVGADSDCGLFVFQELVGDGCVPQPLFAVVALRISACVAVGKVGVEH